MGKRATFFALVLIATTLVSITAEASTSEDVYNLYDKEYSVQIPEDILDTIKRYDNAKKYVSMYSYVINSDYDIESLTHKQEELQKELERVEKELLSGYNKPQSELYALEDTYYDLVKQLSNIEKSLSTYHVEMDLVNAKSVPTYTKYKEALQKKNDIVSKTNVGDIENLIVPVQSAAKLIQNGREESVYKVIEGTGALSPLNGTVSKVYVDKSDGLCVEFDNYNGIKTYVCNLESVDVSEGETVYQNQRIGYCLGTTVKFKLSINDEFVDISKMFVEELSQ